MLTSLHIENIAVIKRLDVDFSCGFTVITGETGAGKSIMIDALHLLSGAKADRELIRHGESHATVGALFSSLAPATLAALDELGLSTDEEGSIEMLRTVTADGKSTSRVNGRTVSLSVLREAMQLLLNIHGQDDVGFLKQSGGELAVLDAAAHNEAERAAYLDAYRALTEVRTRIKELERVRQEGEHLAETLRYQIEDIEEVSPAVGEEDALFDEKLRLKNIGKISKQTGFAYRALRGAPNGNACYILDRAAAALRGIADVLPEAGETADKLEDHAAEIATLADAVRAMTALDGEDPEEALDRVEGRLAALSRLNRKYGGSTERVLAFLSDARERLSHIEGAEEGLSAAMAEHDRLLKNATDAAEALRATRLAAARRIEDEISQNLHALDMPRAVFSASLTPLLRDGEPLFTREGCDKAELLIAVNTGEPLVSVVGCASGGEMSRIMLAIKTVLARHDGMPTVIFDEADTGVSGKTSRKIGLCFRAASASAQIIAITHSAQIASLADRHLLVAKGVSDGRTLSTVRELSYDERVSELARILGGIQITDAQRRAAEDMMQLDGEAGE